MLLFDPTTKNNNIISVTSLVTRALSLSIDASIEQPRPCVRAGHTYTRDPSLCSLLLPSVSCRFLLVLVVPIIYAAPLCIRGSGLTGVLVLFRGAQLTAVLEIDHGRRDGTTSAAATCEREFGAAPHLINHTSDSDGKRNVRHAAGGNGKHYQRSLAAASEKCECSANIILPPAAEQPARSCGQPV